MFAFITNILSGRNQFASDGLLLLLAGGLGVYLRAVPEKLLEWCVNQITLSITVKDDDVAFVWVKEWLLEQKFLKRVRRVDIDTTLRREQQLALIPAPGYHWFWWGKRPFRVELRRSEDKRGWPAKRTETLTFRTVGRRQAFLKTFVQQIAECHEQATCARSSLFVYDEYWVRVEGYRARRLESVILKTGENERLVQDIEQFRASKERYGQLGVPYHRGYLFYGPPGTGKTSLVSALAARFGMTIYWVSLGDLNDKSLMRAVQGVPTNSVILFEDIDCMKVAKARPDADERDRQIWTGKPGDDTGPAERLGVTLSGVLNVLDGFHAPENVLFVMTTNHIEALDPALLRPGRIDYRLELSIASKEQKIALYQRFFPEISASEAREFVEANYSAETMAEFQGLLLSLSQERESELDSMFQDA
jgi:mitochondrial chaperone BCS1